MLSRVADSLFWMARQTERAENIARIVDVNLQLLLDYQKLDDKALKQHWEPLVVSLGDEELFAKLHKKADSANVTDFLTFNPKNPNSILMSVTAARENARSVRDQISQEMWEEINRLYLFVRARDAKKIWKQSPTAFYREVKQSSYLVQGLANATMPRDERRQFFTAGLFLERADKTTRLLDVKYHNLQAEVAGEAAASVDSVQWAAVLRSCSAYETYQQTYSTDILPWKVAELLIFNDSFPRSIRYCANTLDQSLRSISGSTPGTFTREAERISGRLLSELNYSTLDDVLRLGLHDYLDELQQKLNAIGSAIYTSYISHATTSLEEEIQIQKQQQQQQQ
ncbi:MAG: alpha-E domain-containing protein [Candidatus Methylacidiphilales bacterium]|nr:alpha-E domain-containing protein [Candidatus Methylacidiphilales bacterium]